MRVFVEIVGWTGAVLMLLGYGLVSAGRVDGGSRFYQLLNILGAAGFVVNSGWNGAYPSMAVNVIWIAIGVATLVQRARQRGVTGMGQGARSIP